ncbi:hypothetical protein Pflav_090950 [Phytohabitans flavus]|uniref:Uncharacterized protein n=1 Tax=Phytohabitans flavus TaxID=1076124 RepID=A0A6F8Y9A9_9ACTN|nr:hypothetical protein [Phytohabitans flavus]BCB82685.1 hypothetical protein Pflav_090950 [Phytohabitans flavus]
MAELPVEHALGLTQVDLDPQRGQILEGHFQAKLLGDLAYAGRDLLAGDIVAGRGDVEIVREEGFVATTLLEEQRPTIGSRPDDPAVDRLVPEPCLVSQRLRGRAQPFHVLVAYVDHLFRHER